MSEITNSSDAHRKMGSRFQVRGQVLREGAIQRGDAPSVRHRREPRWGAGACFPLPENFDIRHVVRFEGSLISKQAARSELKNVDITQPLNFKVGFFSAKTAYMCIYYSTMMSFYHIWSRERENMRR